jgi:curli biogenesis system outer membrane secretion channel CsgG
MEKRLRDCDGCDAAIALQLGAAQSLVGVVRRVTMTDYYVQIQIRDARTGEILDQQAANFAGDGWASGVSALIRHQVLAQ